MYCQHRTRFYYFRDWRKMSLAYMIPSLGLLGLYFIIPRSVRWLLANKRYLEAEAELQRVAKWNQVPPLTDHDFAKFSKEEAEIEVKESFIDLLKRPKLVFRLLIVFLNWTVVAMVYYGLSLAASTLGGDVFMNFTMLSAMEFPGYAISYFGMQYWGRKSTLIASLLVSGVACLVSGFLPSSLASLHTFLFLVGKFGVTSAFATIYLYTSELFPTSVRNLCIGLSSTVGRVGAIMAPYIKNLGADTGQDWIPLAIFGLSGIISGLAVFLLHETKGKPLPRTLDEAEDQERPDYHTVG
jgi:OCT family organic cation transporter-like MFS transporter 4/5